MSVEGCTVVECFPTRGTSESTLRSSLVVRFQVTSKVFLFPKLFVTAGTSPQYGFVDRLLDNWDVLMFSRSCRYDVLRGTFSLVVARHPFECPTISYYLVLVQTLTIYLIIKVLVEGKLLTNSPCCRFEQNESEIMTNVAAVSFD